MDMDMDMFNVPLSTEEMLFAAGIFNAAYENKSPVSDIFGKEPPNDGKSYLTLKNIPLNRASIALIDAFKEDTAKAGALGFRLMALGKYLQDPRAQQWVRSGEDGETLHHNVFAALAKFTVTESDEQNKENFYVVLEALGVPDDGAAPKAVTA